ncbi:MAG: hypothetical protein ACR2P9_06755 [Gammaproteobacteria bacterium]
MSDKNFQKKVEIKCNALLKLVIGVQKFYKSSDDKSKQFIETTVGAAIWYLPKKNDVLFTGKISKKAKAKGERSEDHPYPRKIAAQKILKHNWKNEIDPVKTLSDLYIKKYGKFNYVSKSENRKLRKYQKSGVFKTSEDAYKEAGVELVKYR